MRPVTESIQRRRHQLAQPELVTADSRFFGSEPRNLIGDLETIYVCVPSPEV